MERFLRDRSIDAGFERPGQLNVALTPAHVAGLEESRKAAERVGSPGWKVLSRDQTQALVASPLYLGALVAPRNALVDPVRLVEGLRAEAERRGVRIFEGAAVAGFQFPADRVLLETPGGRVRARRAVLATNAYSHHLFPRLAFRFLPLYDYILVSEPLAAARARGDRVEGAARRSWTHGRSSTTTA